MSRAPRQEPWQSDTWKRVTDFTPTSRRQRLAAAAVGGLALLAAVAVVAGLGGDTADSLGGPARLFVYLVANAGLAVAGWSLYRGRSVERDETETALPPPEATTGGAETIIGEGIDETLEKLVDPAETAQGWERIDVRNTVRSVAIDVIRRETDADDLQTVLDEGTWTDDPRAAAYLGDVDPPLRTRVTDWASGDPHRRRADAAVRELAALADVETEVESS